MARRSELSVLRRSQPGRMRRRVGTSEASGYCREAEGIRNLVVQQRVTFSSGDDACLMRGQRCQPSNITPILLRETRRLESMCGTTTNSAQKVKESRLKTGSRVEATANVSARGANRSSATGLVGNGGPSRRGRSRRLRERRNAIVSNYVHWVNAEMRAAEVNSDQSAQRCESSQSGKTTLLAPLGPLYPLTRSSHRPVR